MSMAYIRATYKVPAKRGARVSVTFGNALGCGTITGTRGAYLRIRLDQHTYSRLYHPTCGVTYL